MKVCKRDHEHDGGGECPVCRRERDARYNRSEKGRTRSAAYDRSEKGSARYATYRNTDKRADVLARYDQSPKGWLNALRKRRSMALKRRNQRKEAEDS